MAKMDEGVRNMESLLAQFQKAGRKPPKPKKGESRAQYFRRIRIRAHDLPQVSARKKAERTESDSDRRRGFRIGVDGQVSK